MKGRGIQRQRSPGSAHGSFPASQRKSFDNLGHSDGSTVGREVETELRHLIGRKADKHAVEDMFNSIRKALDAKPSYADLQVQATLDCRGLHAPIMR